MRSPFPTSLILPIGITLLLAGLLFAYKIQSDRAFHAFDENLPILKVNHLFSDYIAQVDNAEYDLTIGNSTTNVSPPVLFDQAEVCGGGCSDTLQTIYRQLEELEGLVDDYFEILNDIGNEKNPESAYYSARQLIRQNFDRLELSAVDSLAASLKEYPPVVEAAYNKLRRYEKDLLERSRTQDEAERAFAIFVSAYDELYRAVGTYEDYFETTLGRYQPQSQLGKYRGAMEVIREKLEERNQSRLAYESYRDQLYQHLQAYTLRENEKLSRYDDRLLSRNVMFTVSILLSVLLLLWGVWFYRRYQRSIRQQRILNEIGTQVFNFKNLKSLTKDLRQQVVRLFRQPVDLIFTLYYYEAEKKHLRAYITNQGATLSDEKTFSIQSLESQSVKIFHDYREGIVKIGVTDQSRGGIRAKDERKSRLYRLLKTRENKRLGLVSFQSTLKNVFTDEHERVLDAIGTYVEAALDYDNIRNSIAQLGQKIIRHTTYEELVVTIYDILCRIINDKDKFVFAIGLRNDQNGTVDFTAKGRGAKLKYGSDDLRDTKLISVFAMESGVPMIIEDKDQYLRENSDIHFPELDDFDDRQSFIYVPVVYRDKKLGLLTIQSHNQDAFSQKHLDFLQIISVLITQYLVGQDLLLVQRDLHTAAGQASTAQIRAQLSPETLESYRQLLIKGELKRFFQETDVLLQREPIFVALSAKYERLEQGRMAGTLSQGDVSIGFSSIVFSLVEWLNEIAPRQTSG